MAGKITHGIRKIEAFSIFIEFMKNLYKDRHMITTMAIRELKSVISAVCLVFSGQLLTLYPK